MSMIKEFKEFALKGNVVDMAVGIIIGGAFGTIVKSLVSDVIMPPIGMLMGNVDFSQLFIVLNGSDAPGSFATIADAQAAGAVTINYGMFFNNVISFVIVAFAVFMLIKSINNLKKEQAAAPPEEPTTHDCPHCFSSVSLKATRCPFCTSEINL